MNDQQKSKKELLEELDRLKRQLDANEHPSTRSDGMDASHGDASTHLQTLMEYLDSGILFENKERRILYVNSKFCSLFNIPVPTEALVGMDCSQSAEQSAVLFRDPTKFIKRIKQLITEKKIVLHEELELADGRTFERDYIPLNTGKEHNGHLWHYRDISEQVNLQKLVRESEQRFKMLANFTRDWEYWIAPDLTLVFNSPSSEQITGYTADEFYQRPSLLEEIIHEEDKHFMMKHLHEHLDDPEPFSADFRIRTKNGELRWLSHSCQPIWSKDGTWLGRRASNRDITQRKEFEHALQESETKHKALLSAIPDWIFLQTKDGVYLDYQAKDISNLAAPPENFIGKNMFTIFPLYLAKQFARHFENVFQSNSLQTLEYDYHGKAGLEHYEARSVPLDDQRVLTIVRNITERKQIEMALKESERNLNEAQAISHIGSWKWDFQTNKVSWSDEMFLLFGISKEEFDGNVEHAIERAVLPEDKPKLFEANKRVRQNLTPVPLEYRVVLPDGNIRIVFAEGKMIRDKHNFITGIAGTVQDITERKTIELSLQRRDQILEAVGKSAEALVKSHLVNEGIQETLRVLGVATNSSRVYIFENHLDKEETVLTSQRFEWCAEGIVPQIDNPDLQNAPLEDIGFRRWIDSLSQNKPIYGNIKEFPEAERDFLALQEIKSIVIMPIYIGTVWWGFIGFDECVQEREWSIAEIEALHAAAGMLGAALQHQQAEIILSEQEQQYRTLFDLSPVGILVEDTNGFILRANATICRSLGYSLDELVGVHVSKLNPPAFVNEIDEHTQRILSGETLIHEVQNIKKDGTLCYVELYETAITLPNHEPGILVIAKDITERKQTEMKLLNSEISYRGLFDSVSDAIYIQDVQGKFLDVNRGAEQMYGYPKEFFVGKTPEILSAPGKNDMQKTFEHVQKAFQGKSQRFEFWGIRSNGEIFPKDVVLNPGTYFGQPVLIALARDITERKRMEEEREQLVSDLQEAMASVKTLGGLLPICAGCKKIRDDKGYWEHVENYIMQHTAATFTHGMCPECSDKYFPEYRRIKEMGSDNQAKNE
ncbi:MAG: PAS domain S-box protein [Ignavibacteriae bacterium]|nr:PAS domain S-box protein [Ignavibacteriota bacterium]